MKITINELIKNDMLETYNYKNYKDFNSFVLHLLIDFTKKFENEYTADIKSIESFGIDFINTTDININETLAYKYFEIYDHNTFISDYLYSISKEIYIDVACECFSNSNLEKSFIICLETLTSDILDKYMYSYRECDNNFKMFYPQEFLKFLSKNYEIDMLSLYNDSKADYYSINNPYSGY